MARRRPALPERLRIGAQVYGVRRDDEFLDDQDDRELAGMSSKHHGQIVLRDANHQEEADTLLHEILHQCLAASGCDPDLIRRGRGANGIEEQVVSAITGPLLGALRDHPELVRFLCSRVDTDR